MKYSKMMAAMLLAAALAVPGQFAMAQEAADGTTHLSLQQVIERKKKTEKLANLEITL